MNVATVGLVPSLPAASSGAGRDAGFVEQLDRLDVLPDALGTPAQNNDSQIDKARVDTEAADSSFRSEGPTEHTDGAGDDAGGPKELSRDSDPVAAVMANVFDPGNVSAMKLEEPASPASQGGAPPSESVSSIDGEAGLVEPDAASGVVDITDELPVVVDIKDAQRTEAGGTTSSVADGTNASNSEAATGDVTDAATKSPGAAALAVSQAPEAVDQEAPQRGFPRSVTTDASQTGAALTSEEGLATLPPNASQPGPVAALGGANSVDPAELSAAEEPPQSTVGVVDPEPAGPVVETRPVGPTNGAVAVEVPTVQAASPQAAGSQVPAPIGTTGIATTPAMISAARVLDMLEVMALQPPPRTLTLDLTDLHGVRVTLALDGGGVNVSVSDSGAGNESAQEWARQLEQLLSERDFGSDARTPNPSPEDQDVSSERSALASVAVSTTTTQSTELRL